MMVVLDMGFWNFRESSILKGIEFAKRYVTLSRQDYKRGDVENLIDWFRDNMPNRFDMPFFTLSQAFYRIWLEGNPLLLINERTEKLDCDIDTFFREGHI